MTKRVKLNTPEEVEDLIDIGVPVMLEWKDRYPPEVVDGYLLRALRKDWSTDHNFGRYYFIEVEEDEDE